MIDIKVMNEISIVKTVDEKEYSALNNGSKQFICLHVDDDTKKVLSEGIHSIIAQLRYDNELMLKFRIKQIHYICISIINEHVYIIIIENN